MPAEFHEDGVRFQYPENWTLTRDDIDDGWLAEVQSPQTAFVLVGLRTDRPMPADLVAATMADLKGEYDNLEADPAATRIAGREAIGTDARFFSFDLTNTCSVRAFASPFGTVLVMWQANDLDLERTGPVLQAIVASLRVDR